MSKHMVFDSSGRNDDDGDDDDDFIKKYSDYDQSFL